MAKKLNYKNSRQINIKNFEEIKKILSPLELRRDLLIEHLHLIQDSFGHISEDSLISLSTLLKLSMVEVYEVATFYAHFDVIKDGERIPPKFTIRVCDSLSCELSGSNQLKKMIWLTLKTSLENHPYLLSMISNLLEVKKVYRRSFFTHSIA